MPHQNVPRAPSKPTEPKQESRRGRWSKPMTPPHPSRRSTDHDRAQGQTRDRYPERARYVGSDSEPESNFPYSSAKSHVNGAEELIKRHLPLQFSPSKNHC